GSVQEHLSSLIPEAVADRVHFEPPIDRAQLGTAMAGGWVAVFPSRFDTFGSAVHECRRLGLPVIVPQRPEFAAFFSSRTGALVYDTTVEGLRSALAEILEHPELRSFLADAPGPEYPDPLSPYTPHTPRHTRTQAGLATAALSRMRAAATSNAPETPKPMSDRLLDALPESAAGWLESRDLDSPAVRRWRRRRAAGAWEREVMERSWRTHPELSDPAVSIIIPCFNQGQFLHDAIRSVLRQTYDSWEIIVVDDGSTDPETAAVLRALHYPRTRIVRQRNRGPSAARNAGVAIARGTYLVPLDADDELGLAFLSATVSALEGRPDAGFAHTGTRLFGHQNLVWVDRPYNPYQLLLSLSIVGCALIRTEAMRAVGGYDEALRQGNEDWDLWVRFLEHGWGQVEVARPLFRYRQHGITSTVRTEARFEQARLEMARDHPALYQPEALRAMKAEWYPWVSVVVDDSSSEELLESQSLDDLEIVYVGSELGPWAGLCSRRGWPLRAGGSGLESAVRLSRGKFLIDWRPVTDAGPQLLEELASLLEDDVDAYGCAVEAGCHPVLWRRWSLLDPGADPHRLAKTGTRGAGPAVAEADYLGAFPHPRWAIDPGDFETPLYRVRPEVEGRFPQWLP
ncbi:MAG: glycosyltransferase, partial [Acidimicrobiia bacterium]|nr:glycosyltransferase [Acidimicrobiia bacterium]